jgi:hypothetical protein
MANINTTMGIKSIKYGEVGATALTAVGDVYQDTCTFVENDPTITEHKSETSRKKIVIKRSEGYSLAFSIMDPTPDELKAFKGGTVTDGIWKEADTDEQISMCMEIAPAEGKTLVLSDVSVSAKINTTYSATGITLLEVTCTPQAAISYK